MNGHMPNCQHITARHLTAIIAALLLLVMEGCTSSRFGEGGHTFRQDNPEIDRRFQIADLGGQQLEAATRYGLSKPIRRRSGIWLRAWRRRKIKTNRYYLLDPMPHSNPYLTSGGKWVLKTIAKRFQKKLRKAGYREHRIIVTSMLRTREDIGGLKKINRVAATNSSHMYGTTFDVSFTRFNRISMDGMQPSNRLMANLLGEVICELREEGECWIIFERSQHCYHVTARR